MDFLNTPKFNLPQAPKSSGTSVNAGALLTAPFKAIGNLFSPSTTNFTKPTHPLAGLGSGYNPIQSFQALGLLVLQSTFAFSIQCFK